MDPLKKRVCDAIDHHAEQILDIGDRVLRHPELGYKETGTSAYVQEILRELTPEVTAGHAVTGVKAWCRGGKGRLNLALLGELDAVICHRHPFADPVTGAAHACGHHAQLAGMLGAAVGLVRSGVLRELDGNLCLFATPAEEFVEIEYRRTLAQKQEISYLGGKQQLIAEGAFDNIDLALMFHGISGGEQPTVRLQASSLGFVGKSVRFIGKEAHAGACPHKGINALNAASLAIMAIHARRETFRDEDSVRVHPILTKGGDLVNTVPAEVRMESYVRAGNIEAMMDANSKVNQAIRGAAYAIGAKAEIEDMPGYLPMQQSSSLSEVFAENARSLLGNGCVEYGGAFPGSTDLGDVSYMMPVLQALVNGFGGELHSQDFSVLNRELAYLVPAKLLAMTAIDLLKEDAALGRSIVDGYERHTSAEYRALWEGLLSEQSYE